MKHYHAWAHPDDGSIDGKTDMMYRLAHPHRTRQAARAHGKKWAFFAAVMACEESHERHICSERCPDGRFRRGGNADE